MIVCVSDQEGCLPYARVAHNQGLEHVVEVGIHCCVQIVYRAILIRHHDV